MVLSVSYECNAGFNNYKNKNSAFYLLCLINEHYRDIVFYPIQQFAIIADKAVLRIIELYVPFAFGAYKYVKKFLADWHI
jgi:hypothetical protein